MLLDGEMKLSENATVVAVEGLPVDVTGFMNVLGDYTVFSMSCSAWGNEARIFVGAWASRWWRSSPDKVLAGVRQHALRIHRDRTI